MYNITRDNPVVSAAVATVATTLVGAMLYVLFEPTAMFAASAPDEFVVTQEIGAEISFSTPAADVTMAGAAIGGETGGTRFGSTTLNVTTNDSSGYTLAIRFDSANGMEHGTLADFIDYYATSSPDYDMGLGVNSSGFAYSVSSTNQVSDFNNNGTGCGAVTTRSIDNCFQMHGTPTGNFTIVDSNSSATAEETIIGFQVQVGPSSGLANGFYYATTTLTATTKS